MEKAKTKLSVLCPDHEDQLLVRVNPDPSASKHLYCYECLMQSQDPKSLYASFPKISDFLTTAAASLAERKGQITPISEVPREFLDMIGSQGESLEKLSKHIDGEKKKIETFFDNLKDLISDTLNQLKNEHLELLDNQVTNLHEGYVVFEKMLTRFYPKKEDIEVMFPTKEELEARLEKVETALDLNDHVKNIKQTLAAMEDDKVLSSNPNDDLKKAYFVKFEDNLKEIERNKPTFEEKDSKFQSVKDEVKQQLNQLLQIGQVFLLKNTISADLLKLNSLTLPTSAIIQPQDFEILKGWLPPNFDFNPALLFRMSKDGKSSKTFHSLCDKKGPTITLIKCKYEDASQMSIIGGFSDKDFYENGLGFTRSTEAFIFSLDSKTKFPILRPEHAVWNGRLLDIWFGNSGTIGIQKDFTSGATQIFPLNSGNETYQDSFKIIPNGIYKGHRSYAFKVEEVEVYKVNTLV